MTASTKKEIYRLALELRDSGKLFAPGDEDSADMFLGSVDRFCDIAYALRDHHKVLDIGPSAGVLVSLLHELGHECCAVDVVDMSDKYPWVLKNKISEYRLCNAEIEALPWPDETFDAVTCCQALEHFTHSHLFAVKEMHRVLKPGGILEIDVPNAVCFRNRSRMLRGKHITWDYKQYYLYAEPLLQNGMSFYPIRHNREFTLDELELLFCEAGFEDNECRFLKSRRHREGLEKLKSIGTALKDSVPSWRKSLIGYGRKPAN